MSWERVYTINDYYDQPRLGVADFNGKPHVYERRFSESEDEYTDEYLLMEIAPELFALILEDWEIFLRWRAAFRRGEVDIATHPALPPDRSRHLELQTFIGDRLKPSPEKSLLRNARFRSVDGRTEVEWNEIAEGKPSKRRDSRVNS